MRAEIDGATIRTTADLHSALSRALDFGPYYGGNLAALWDRLTTDVERPVELVWSDSELSRAAMGETEFAKVRDLLLRVQEQDLADGGTERFSVTFA
ncbi:barstar family protein [Streptomyces monomycini]|uniref:barstar family protein n=1 Tax=Streptomyces monomycini TaxID=371720 RepID=UPI0005196982|nr:barstar family protein [Streptomyces monomycini]